MTWVRRGDLPFPAGFCAGYWGYDLRQFVEPKLRPHPGADPAVPDCWLGCYDSLVVFDHETGRAWVVSTGLEADGSRLVNRRETTFDFWRGQLETPPAASPEPVCFTGPPCRLVEPPAAGFVAAVAAAQRYIGQGDIYQVNLSRCWEIQGDLDGGLYRALTAESPAPFAAYLEAGDITIASSSPELFLRLDGLSCRRGRSRARGHVGRTPPPTRRCRPAPGERQGAGRVDDDHRPAAERPGR